jgi:beta-glucuronidase
MGEPAFQHADIVGFNEYRGAMDPFERLDPDLAEAAAGNPGKPLLILENGAWAAPGRRGSKLEQNTEDWQADLLLRQHEVLARHTPPLAGYTYWLLCDYRSRKFYTNRSHGWSGMGMYSKDGQPKLVRDVFRTLQW